MPSQSKVATVTEIRDWLGGVSSIVLTDYRGLSVKEMQGLRRALRDAGCEITVYKNRLAKIALAELQISALDEHLNGPTAFAVTSGDPVGLAKALSDYAKKHAALELKAGYVDGAALDAAGVRALADLPSREELYAKLMGSLLNPVRGFMAMANAPAGALARAMRAVADQKAAA